MASKTTKRARKAAEQNHPAEKDDGSRWLVQFTDEHPTPWLRGRTAYPGEGVSKKEARRLAKGLFGPTRLVCVKEA